MSKSFAGQFGTAAPGPSKADTMSKALGIDRAESLTTLAVDKIRPNPNQPRRQRSQAKFEELVESIRARGLLQPIRVREIKTNEAYEIIAGEGRWRAHKELHMPEIAAVIVRDQTPEQAYIDALIENVVREDMNPIDRAEALMQIRVNLGLRSWPEVGRVPGIGLTRQQIYNLLGLTRLPEPVQDDIRSGRLTEKHGRALRALQHTPQLLEQARVRMIRDNLSGDAALEFVKTLKHGAPKSTVQVFTVNYQTDDDLIIALEAKLAELRHAQQSSTGDVLS